MAILTQTKWEILTNFEEMYERDKKNFPNNLNNFFSKFRLEELANFPGVETERNYFSSTKNSYWFGRLVLPQGNTQLYLADVDHRYTNHSYDQDWAKTDHIALIDTNEYYEKTLLQEVLRHGKSSSQERIGKLAFNNCLLSINSYADGNERTSRVTIRNNSSNAFELVNGAYSPILELIYSIRSRRFKK